MSHASCRRRVRRQDAGRRERGRALLERERSSVAINLERSDASAVWHFQMQGVHG